MRRVAVLAVLAGSALAVCVAPAGATRECDGLQVCVPLAGPWIVVPTSNSVPRPRVEYHLSCPRGYIVGGLDAELTDRAIDISFVGALGSPVNPGITTTRSVVFVASYVGVVSRFKAPTFRPHVGCMPTSGGGRVLTSAGVVAPGKPTVRHVSVIHVDPGTRVVTKRCAAGERLIAASHAVGFFSIRPPGVRLVRSVQVSRRVRAGRVSIVVRAGQTARQEPVVVQVSLVCAGGA